MVILRPDGGPHDPRISTHLFPQASVVVGIIEFSAVDRPYSTTVAHSRVAVLGGVGHPLPWSDGCSLDRQGR